MPVKSKSVVTTKADMDDVMSAWRNDGWTLTNAVEQSRNKWLLIFEREVAKAPSTYVYGTAKKKKGNAAVGCLALLVIAGGVYLCGRSVLGSSSRVAPTRTPRERTAVVALAEPTQARTFVAAVEPPGEPKTAAVTPTDSGLSATAPGAASDPRPTGTVRPTRTPSPRPSPQIMTAVVNSNANLRSCPNTTCDIVGGAVAGDVLVIFSSQDGWYEVRTANRQIAYIADFLVTIGGPTRTPRPVVTRAATQPDLISARDRQDASNIRDSLAILAGGRNVEIVMVIDGRPNGGTRSAQVTYLSTESTEYGLIEEMLDILDAVYVAREQYDIDLDEVALIVGDPFGTAVAVVAIDIDDLVAFRRGSISRGQFILRMQIVTF